MKVQFVWKKCRLNHRDWHTYGQNAFWLQVHESELEKVLAHVSDPKRFTVQVKKQVSPEGFFYLLVAQDISSIVNMPQYYPYSGQWNGYSPFEKVRPVEIEDLRHLAHIM